LYTCITSQCVFYSFSFLFVYWDNKKNYFVILSSLSLEIFRVNNACYVIILIIVIQQTKRNKFLFARLSVYMFRSCCCWAIDDAKIVLLLLLKMRRKRLCHMHFSPFLNILFVSIQQIILVIVWAASKLVR
jgi:hypothetical protein